MPPRECLPLAYGLAIYQAREIAERIATRLRELSDRFAFTETVQEADGQNMPSNERPRAN